MAAWKLRCFSIARKTAPNNRDRRPRRFALACDDRKAMLERLKSMLRPPERKASRTARLIALESGGRARWTPRDYAALAREGYSRNAIVHRAVRLIAESIGGLSFVLYEGAAERDAHPLLDLLARPNPRQDGASLLENISAHLLLAGNAYIEAVGLAGQGNDQAGAQSNVQVRELYALRPDRMKVVPGPDGWPQAYEYTVAGSTVRFDQSSAQPPILHLTFFNPIDDYYGLSPLEAAAVAVDTHNAAAKWNKALLDNAARPSGALVYTGPDGLVLADQQFERLKKELAEQYQGTANAGRPLLLEGGLDWKAMSLSPKDMDFMEAKHSAAREIALAFGVPPMLLAIPGDNTYSNYQEASRVFWRQTVLPLAGRIGSALTQWLAPSFGAGLTLAVDTDRIEALTPDRAALWERVTKAPFLTVNEKRAAVGYGAVAGGDVFA
jgi:HK97 family phage portal protein